MSYCYDYPRPMVTVDIFLLRIHQQELQLLLIQRDHEPFENCWALPGGFVDENESLEAAALRELREETGISGVGLKQLAAFGDPGRDPRGHTVTIVYGGMLPLKARVPARAGDDARSLRWFDVNRLPELAFDHEKIISHCLNMFQHGVLFKFW